VTFGSAHLFVGGMPAATARALLEAAVTAGATRLDTAPSYGHGASEALVARVAAAAGVPVTTKVGLEPVPPPSAAKAAAGRVLRALPAPVGRAVRAARAARATATGGPGAPGAATGRFTTGAVRASVERSLRALAPAGRIDRLLLHEVAPGDLTDELLALLAGYRAAGDVGELGVATQNQLTAACLARAPELLSVAHVSASLRGPAVPAVPAGVHLAGHGLLGAAGTDLAAARRALRRRAAGPLDDGALAAAVLRLAATQGAGLPEVVVATRRLDRVAAAVTAPADPGALRALGEEGGRALLAALLGARAPAGPGATGASRSTTAAA
jgi:hypothetical protein